MTETKIDQIGKLLRASTTGFVVGCHVSKVNQPSFGALVRVPLADDLHIYGLIYDIHVDDDGLVRQLATTEDVSDFVINDNRVNRNVPLEVSVLAVGYRQSDRVYHLLPPRPPLSLDSIYLCDPQELCDFTSSGRFGYFRHILRATDLPLGELLAAHISQVQAAQSNCGNSDWHHAATQELIVLLRDDYPTLMGVLGALSDAI